jgi:hypothetical protein
MINSILVMIISSFLTIGLEVRPMSRSVCGQALELQQKKTTSDANSDRASLDFKEVMVGEQMTQDGTKRPFHTWKASDGVSVTSFTQEFRSHAQANHSFSKRLKQASQVIEKKPKVDKAGHQVGQRAVVTFSYPGKKEQFSGIIWTEGSIFHDVESVSPDHAILFEKEFYPN